MEQIELKRVAGEGQEAVYNLIYGGKVVAERITFAELEEALAHLEAQEMRA